jgi:1-acyl-sn-glycerol-3-phosphate acyltransferase
MATLSLAYAALAVVLLPARHLRMLAANGYAKLLGRGVLWIAGVELAGRPFAAINEARPAIFVFNHASAMDAFICMWLCPFGACGIAKQEIRRVPFFGLAWWMSGSLLIDRFDHDEALAGMGRITAIIQKYSLSVFMSPEGTRPTNGHMGPFKKGFAHLALATGLPIVPIAIHDAHRVWPARTLRLAPGVVRIEVLEAVTTANWKRETIDDHIGEIWNRIDTRLGPDQRGLPVRA